MKKFDISLDSDPNIEQFEDIIDENIGLDTAANLYRTGNTKISRRDRSEWPEIFYKEDEY